MTNGGDYERGRREAALEARVTAIEYRLEDHSDALRRIGRSMDALDERVGALDKSLATREEVDAALKDAANSLTRTQLGRREYWLGLAMVLGTIGVFLATLLLAVHP